MDGKQSRQLGITFLFSLIRECEGALTIVTEQARKALSEFAMCDLPALGHPERDRLSYFDLVGTPAGVAFDTALRHLRANSEKARDFLDGFRRRVNEALENEFYEEVVVRKKVKRKYAVPFKAHIFAYTDLCKTLLDTSGSLPQIQVSEPGPEPRA